MSLLGMQFDESSWHGLVNFSQDGSYAVGDVSKYNDFLVVLVYGGTYRQGFLFPKAVMNANAAMPDFTMVNLRLYFKMTVSGTSLVITDWHSDLSSASISVYAR